PPVPRRRRAALVASAGGPRSAHALLRRLSLAGLCHVALCRRDRRYRRVGGTRAVSHGPTGAAGGGIVLRLAAGFGRFRHALRALRPRPRQRPALRRTWPAADGLRRLE